MTCDHLARTSWVVRVTVCLQSASLASTELGLVSGTLTHRTVFNDGWISEWKGMPWIRNDIKGERQGSGAGIRLVHGWQHHHIAAAQPDPPKEATSKGKAKDQASLVL